MYYIVDIPTCNRLGLQGAEVLVFSCLAYLCRDKGYWNGSYSKLAEYSLCGGKTTAFRVCSLLTERGCIKREGNRFYVVTKTLQNGTAALQNGTAAYQNVTIPEKESTKEKEIIKEKIVGIKKDQPTQIFEDSSFSPPTKQEAAKYAKSRNIPIEIVGKWWYYWDENNWTRENGRRIRKWQSSLEGFVLREKKSILQIAGVPQKQVQQIVRESRNEQIRQAMLQQQHEEREKAEKDAVPMPESLKRRLAAFGIV